MATVSVDIVDGGSGKLTVDGWELTRIATVSGLTGTGNARLIEAVAAVAAVTGNIGSAHPGYAYALLESFQPEHLSTNVVKVSCVYKTLDPADDVNYAEIEVGTSLEQVETNKDTDGNLITVSYTYPADYKLDDKKRNQTITQSGTVSTSAPKSSIVYSRRETGSPGSKSREYVGNVNAAGWQLDQDSPGADARTWKCMSIVGRSQDGGVTFDVTYVFEYRADTWEEWVRFVNPDDGKTPSDVAAAGLKRVLPYGIVEKDFDLLGLS
jgi:hypothetical protein